MLKQYYRLTKPGIIYGNALTVIAGFVLASHGRRFDLRLLLAVLVGTSLVIASACVVNNYIDRGIDAKMARTKKRSLVTGAIDAKFALVYAAALGLIGFLVLAVFVNWLVVSIGAGAFIFYVVFYGLGKRRSIHGTLIGSVPGAAPPVAGYCAVTGRLDMGALLLFLIMVAWQMPHFYAIAMYRFDDYKAAGLPVMPVKKGFLATKLQIIFYVVAFIAAAAALSLAGYTGKLFLAVMTVLGFAWLGLGLRGFKALNDKLWARRMFLFSLVILLSLSFMICVNAT